MAFVLAIGIRAYFLQPFKIPTGSMEPTLNGIVAHPIPVGQPLPGAARQLFESLWLGRTYVDAVSEVDDQVVDLRPERRFGFLSYTRIECSSGRSYLVHAPPETLTHRKDSDGFGVYPHRFIQDTRSLVPGYVGKYRAGEPIARGYVATGDQVFVDKFTYNFRFPRRSDVFVFSTRGIAEIPMDDPNVKSQFYIKRLAGTPGDQLSINQPRLYINGALAQEPGFKRVMTGQHGYRGYSNTVPPRLTTPDDAFTVPPDSYSRWATTALTAPTVAISGSCRQQTSSGGDSSYTGHLRGIGARSTEKRRRRARPELMLMHDGMHRVWWLVGGALAGYVVLMLTNPARPSLRDGLRCLRRYPQVWLWPAGFALAHSGFRLWRHAYESWIIPNAPSVFRSVGRMAACAMGRYGGGELAAGNGKHLDDFQLCRHCLSALCGCRRVISQ